MDGLLGCAGSGAASGTEEILELVGGGVVGSF